MLENSESGVVDEGDLPCLSLLEDSKAERRSVGSTVLLRDERVVSSTGWGRNLRGLVWEGMAWLSSLCTAASEETLEEGTSEGSLAEPDVGTEVWTVSGLMLRDLREGGEMDKACVGKRTDQHVPLVYKHTSMKPRVMPKV